MTPRSTFSPSWTSPRKHWAKICSINPIERLNDEIKGRNDVDGIFPNGDAIIRLVGAILIEQNDEWAMQRARYMTLETIALISDNLNVTARSGRMTSPAWPEMVMSIR